FLLWSLFLSTVLSLYNLLLFQIVSLALSLLFLILAGKMKVYCKGLLNKKGLSDFLHYGKFSLGNQVGSILYKNTDTWLLGKLVSLNAVATYNPAIKLANIIELPLMAVNAVYFPKSVQLSLESNKDSLSLLYGKFLKTVFLIQIPTIMLFYLFSEELIVLIMGQSNQIAEAVLHVTLLYTFFIPFDRAFSMISSSLNKPQVYFYYLIILVITNVVLNILWIGHYGIIGAAYATLVTYGVGFLMNQTWLYTAGGIKPFLNSKK
ncbi:MAG: oligosaccharide flippase family protein, partial [Cyclobacteriaceae bacterium]|nr:oligosaccharide flippase family protein [Cyclobacteriaceae bacterium]